MATFSLNKSDGDPLLAEDLGDGTSALVVIYGDNPALLTAAPAISGIFPLNKSSGLPLRAIANADGTSSLVILSYDVGNIYRIEAGQTYTVPSNRENIITAPMWVLGTLVVQGRNTVL